MRDVVVFALGGERERMTRIEITDEMVNRAHNEFARHGLAYGDRHAAVRAALNAALNPPERRTADRRATDGFKAGYEASRKEAIAKLAWPRANRGVEDILKSLGHTPKPEVVTGSGGYGAEGPPEIPVSEGMLKAGHEALSQRDGVPIRDGGALYRTNYGKIAEIGYRAMEAQRRKEIDEAGTYKVHRRSTDKI